MKRRKNKEDFILLYSTILGKVDRKDKRPNQVLWSLQCCCGEVFEKYSRSIIQDAHCGCKTSERKSLSRRGHNLEGLVVGTLTILNRNDDTGLWKCLCKCGRQLETSRYSLTVDLRKSCGCLQNKTHGMSNTKEHNTWLNLRGRCLNPNHKQYEDYGGRGINVCDRWIEKFENFYEDLGPAPTKDHSIERIDVNGNYCPENCIWLERKYQTRNQRSTVLNIERVKDIRARYALGETYIEIADSYDINRATIHSVVTGKSWKDC